jgi:hypothetical protein
MPRSRCTPELLEHRIAKLEGAIDLVVRAHHADEAAIAFVLRLEHKTRRARLALIAGREDEYSSLVGDLEEGVEQVLGWFFEGAIEAAAAPQHPNPPRVDAVVLQGVEAIAAHASVAQVPSTRSRPGFRSIEGARETTTPPPEGLDHEALLARSRRTLRPTARPSSSGVRPKVTLPSPGNASVRRPA